MTGSIALKSIVNVLTEKEWGLLDDRMADMLVYATEVTTACLRGLCVDYDLTTGLRQLHRSTLPERSEINSLFYRLTAGTVFYLHE